jgi:hypothetical protein
VEQFVHLLYKVQNSVKYKHLPTRVVIITAVERSTVLDYRRFHCVPCDFVGLTDFDVHLLQTQIERQPVTDFQKSAKKIKILRPATARRRTDNRHAAILFLDFGIGRQRESQQGQGDRLMSPIMLTGIFSVITILLF